MSKELHKAMIGSIEDYTRRYTIVRGMCDIIEKHVGAYFVINNDYWIMLGNLSDESINDVFSDSYFGDYDGVTREWDNIIFVTFDESEAIKCKNSCGNTCVIHTKRIENKYEE